MNAMVQILREPMRPASNRASTGAPALVPGSASNPGHRLAKLTDGGGARSRLRAGGLGARLAEAGPVDRAAEENLGAVRALLEEELVAGRGRFGTRPRHVDARFSARL